jgi:Spy/CpxP family protein refolding chaperone
MGKGMLMWTTAVAVVGGAMLATDLATAAPTTMPAAATTKPAARVRGLVKPWSELKSLTQQQQQQIAKLHEDALAQEGKIEEKEHDDITALLTPEQKAELADLEAKDKAARKEKAAAAAAARKKATAATQPAK